MNEVLLSAQCHIYGTVWILVCIVVVVCAAIGRSGFRKLRSFNHKYHIVSIDSTEVRFADDDEDYEYSVHE